MRPGFSYVLYFGDCRGCSGREHSRELCELELCGDGGALRPWLWLGGIDCRDDTLFTKRLDLGSFSPAKKWYFRGAEGVFEREMLPMVVMPSIRP